MTFQKFSAIQSWTETFNLFRKETMYKRLDEKTLRNSKVMIENETVQFKNNEKSNCFRILLNVLKNRYQMDRIPVN